MSSRSPLLRTIATRVVPMFAAVFVVGCGGASAHPHGPAEVAEDPGSVRLILHDPTGTTAPKDECASELCTSLLGLIEGAATSIDFAVYGMRNQTRLLDALKAAKTRGVKIRGVVDRDIEGRNYYSSTEKLVAAVGDVRSDYEADKKIAEQNQPFESRATCRRPLGFAGPLQCLTYDLGDRCVVAAHASREALGEEGSIMHNKFFVVDERWVWTGSTNVSDSGTGGYNANLITLVDSKRVARWYTEEFEQMYESGRYHGLKESRPPMEVRVGDAKLHVLFSPQDRPISDHVRRILRGAKKRIDVGVFFLTHKGITADLIAAHRRGVKVRVIIDATAAKNGYTKHELLRAASIPVKIETWGGKMHMKSAAVDGRTVITGSMNFTTAGEFGNDENTIIVVGERYGAQYEKFFDKLWNSLGDQWLVGRPDPESKSSSTSCTDGVDNDFDRKADAADPGCGDDPPPLPALPPWRIVPKREGVCDVDDPSPLESSKPEGAS